MRECFLYNNAICKCSKSDCCHDGEIGCAEMITKCPSCGTEFEEDDFAYALETGLCQYCHLDIV